jgi:glycosyltransferase involved in cell wall biosynthesis
MKLSVCIATYNEEKNIHYALDSTISWVDEVIIVDGGSRDKTLDILRSYGKKVKILSTSNPKIFHINKQKAIEKAKGRWILQLDADEEITPALKAEIQNIVGQVEPTVGNSSQNDIKISIDRTDLVSQTQNGKIKHITVTDSSGQSYIFDRSSDGLTMDFVKNRSTLTKSLKDEESDISAYQIARKNFFLGRPLMKGGVYPDHTIRLYRNKSMVFPCKDVHENVVPINYDNVRGKRWLGTLQNPMNHYSDPTFGRYFVRWNRYNDIEAKRLIQKASKLYGKSSMKLILWKVLFVIKAFFWLPVFWFGKSYLRHGGFLDGWQGFVFHLMSAVRWWGIGWRVINK